MMMRLALLLAAGLLALILVEAPLERAADAAPVCTTDATTKKITCKETVPAAGDDPLFEIAGEAKNAATNQRIPFGPWAFPACGPIRHEIKDGTFTLEWTCEEGFTITFTITRKR